MKSLIDSVDVKSKKSGENYTVLLFDVGGFNPSCTIEVHRRNRGGPQVHTETDILPVNSMRLMTAIANRAVEGQYD